MSESMSEWISVDDRLPIEAAEVVHYETVEVIGTDGIRAFPCEFKRGNVGEDWWAFEVEYNDVTVTMWQPLPEPPKESNQ